MALLLAVLVAQVPAPGDTPFPWFSYYVRNIAARSVMLSECRRLSAASHGPTPMPVPSDVTTQCIAAAHAEAIVRERRAAANGGSK